MDYLKKLLESLTSPELKEVIKSIEEGHVAHREYVRVRRLALTHAALAPPGTVILIVGPSRVGKSRIAKALKDELASPGDDQGCIPLIGAEAVTTGNLQSTMKYLTLRLLIQAKHPVYVDMFAINASLDGYRPSVPGAEHLLRGALESAIICRNIGFILIDEAHHLIRTQSDDLAKQNLDSVKTLGNLTGVVTILIAGYEILQKGFLSAHLNGRMRILHFPRYSSEPEDVDAFDNGLFTLSKMLPFRKGESLLDFRDALRQGSLGGFGGVVTWSYAAIAEMDANGGRFLKPRYFEATRFAAQVDTNEEDINMGEALLRSLIFADAGELNKCAADTKKQTKKLRGKARPFQRKVKRLVVGSK